MNTDTLTQLTLENFTEQTGLRFRPTDEQAARIAISNFPADQRDSLASMSVDELATALSARNRDGNPLRWITNAHAIFQGDGWSDSLELTREGAFQEFIESGGLQRRQGGDSTSNEALRAVADQEDLTLQNFGERTLAATGRARRFRVTPEQSERIKAGTLTREQAFAETLAEVRAQ